MRGRKSPVTIAGREPEFTAAWMEPAHTVDDVAAIMGTSRQCAHKWAKEFGLPSRVELRRQAGLPTNGAITRAFRHTAADQLAKLEQALADEDAGPPPVDRNTCITCGGACPLGVLGHPSCTGRKAA
jgi:hypothetical protein